MFHENVFMHENTQKTRNSNFYLHSPIHFLIISIWTIKTFASKFAIVNGRSVEIGYRKSAPRLRREVGENGFNQGCGAAGGRVQWHGLALFP